MKHDPPDPEREKRIQNAMARLEAASRDGIAERQHEPQHHTHTSPRPPRITIEFDFDIGDKVLVSPIGAAGIVLSLWYSDRGIRYQVAWWDNAVRHESYLLPEEISSWKE